MKLNPQGSGLVYSTYLGGSRNDVGSGITVDAAGSAYVTGQTESGLSSTKVFPVTPGAFQTADEGIPDAFVTKLTPDGSALAYSTFLGGDVRDQGQSIAVDASGNAYVTGSTQSLNFPTARPIQPALGGSGSFDAFVTKLNETGTALVYSTYLGSLSRDEGFHIALDTSGNAYVTGQTYSANFPTTPGAFQTSSDVATGDAFVSKIADPADTTPTPTPSPTPTADVIWVEDAVPSGAIIGGDDEGWNWISSAPTPYSGLQSHASNLVQGLHQHYFHSATSTLTIDASDTLFTYVYLDPANTPSEVMLQWNDGFWEHRAYWGANQIPWGTDGTESRRYMGALPPAGQWVRLEVPADQIGLEGRVLNGMAFTLYGGRAIWDRSGKLSN